MDNLKIERLHRRIAARDVDQAVFMAGDKLDLMPASSPRFAAFMASPVWARRIIGVFSPDVPFSVLCREVRA